MAAPILWTPGKMRSSCKKNHVRKIPPFREGGGFGGGGGADFIFMGARIFLNRGALGSAPESAREIGAALPVRRQHFPEHSWEHSPEHPRFSQGTPGALPRALPEIPLPSSTPVTGRRDCKSWGLRQSRDFGGGGEQSKSPPQPQRVARFWSTEVGNGERGHFRMLLLP